MSVPTYRRAFIFALILIALGVALSNAVESSAIGTVMIALGGYFFIVSMARKKQEEQTHES